MKEKFDRIQKLNDGTIIQHGKSNDRVYLLKTGTLPTNKLIEILKILAQEQQYSKIFAKSNVDDLPNFIEQNFVIEAIIPKYFNGEKDLFYVCNYLTPVRAKESEELVNEYNSILKLAKSKIASNRNITQDTDSTIVIRKCTPQDTSQMVDIYRKIFSTYPFPICYKNYLIETMNENIDYYCIKKNHQIIALATAEINYDSKSAEMTDFATLPEYSKQGLATRLLRKMERNTAQKGIKTFHTIARAISPGMNITFAKLNYKFGGRLKNNTNISGNIESMNVWYKKA